MKEYTARNLASLWAIGAELSGADGFHCFRGQSDSRWELIPGVYRGLESLKPPFVPEEDGAALGEMERDLYRAFSLRAKLGDPARGLGKLEQLFLAQHYGAPTRLLDWTRVVNIAAYFAVWENPDVDGVVWCLNLDDLPLPPALGRRPDRQGFSIGKLKVCVDLERLSFLLDHTALPGSPRGGASAIPSDQAGKAEWAGFLVALEPPNVEDRIKNQKGLFTIYLAYDDEDIAWSHSTYLVEVERHHRRELLSRIVIPSDCKRSFRAALERDAGIDPYFLFPDPAGLALLQQRDRVVRFERLSKSR